MWDETEICYSFKTAADKNKQIQILAELNDVPVQTISEILSRNGLIVGTPMKKAAKRKGVDWSVMDPVVSRLQKEGLSAIEIAERLGINVQAIYDRRKYFKKLARGADKPKAEGKRVEKVKKTRETVKEAEIVQAEAVRPDYAVLCKAAVLLKDAGFVIKQSVFDFMDGKFVIEGCVRDE